MRSPSNAAVTGPFNPLPVSVAKISPVDARTTITESEPASEPWLGTQMFVPSKTGNFKTLPAFTVWMMPPFESSLNSLPRLWLVPGTQMFGSVIRYPVELLITEPRRDGVQAENRDPKVKRQDGDRSIVCGPDSLSVERYGQRICAPR